MIIHKSFLTPQLTMSYNSYILMSYLWVILYSQPPLNWKSCIFTISINARTFTRLFGIFSFMSFKWCKVIYLLCPTLPPISSIQWILSKQSKVDIFHAAIVEALTGLSFLIAQWIDFFSEGAFLFTFSASTFSQDYNNPDISKTIF